MPQVFNGDYIIFLRHSEIVDHLNDCMKMVDHPCGRLKLTRMIAKAECYKENPERVIQLLEPWIDCHYGYLPSICTTLIDVYYETDRISDVFSIYYKAIDIIDRKLYNPQCNIPSMIYTLLNRVTVSSIAEHDQKLNHIAREDMIFL